MSNICFKIKLKKKVPYIPKFLYLKISIRPEEYEFYNYNFKTQRYSVRKCDNHQINGIGAWTEEEIDEKIKSGEWLVLQ